ncbi:helix-turn-helix transcriptional regulator [Natronobeatus ordinarius]|uniref:helix-turn-helix transcriptional regulator n=1 Tax=Natronobeatus ordinarius TaxID=2963433 RepID=UPI0020CB9622|nr:MarR family transcriptional regulator [Natronobeatus ordinarius]
MARDIAPSRTDEPIADVAYLARSDHRVPTLVAMTDRPRSRSELCELTGVSSSTIRRTLREFEARNWIRKDGYRYEATRLGEVIALGMEELIERVETERKLRDVWHWLPDAVTEFTIDTWSAMTVTVAEPDAPYRPVNRFESLLRTTTEFRFLRPEVALMEPCLGVLCRLIEGGTEITLIDRPSCHTYFFSTYPERSSEMVAQENFTVLEHDDLPPYGIGLLDDRVAISCYERDSGTVQAVIDTDAPAVRDWAAAVYASFEAEARPPTSEPLPE